MAPLMKPLSANDNMEASARWMTRILIARNEFLAGLELADQLINSGCDVCGLARHAEEAVTFAAHMQPDLVLMDIHLRGSDGIDGIDTAEEIRIRLGVPSLFLFTHSDVMTRRQAEAAHSLGFLVMPCSPRELAAALRDIDHRRPA